MTPDDPLHRCETNSKTLTYFGTGEALEGDKELARIRLVKPGAVVPNEISRDPANLYRSEFNNYPFLSDGVLPCVAEEVTKDHP